MIPVAKRARLMTKLRCKREGTPVTLHWQEWPDGPPAADPTTGAYLTSSTATRRSLAVKAFVHITGPTTSTYRRFAEIEAGDAIVDFPLDLYRITDPGDTNFETGEVTDELTLNAANRALDGVEDTDWATGEIVAPSDLSNVSLEFGGHTWVQKTVGEELAENWDTIYSGIAINRAMLVCKL